MSTEAREELLEAGGNLAGANPSWVPSSTGEGCGRGNRAAGSSEIVRLSPIFNFLCSDCWQCQPFLSASNEPLNRPRTLAPHSLLLALLASGVGISVNNEHAAIDSESRSSSPVPPALSVSNCPWDRCFSSFWSFGFPLFFQRLSVGVDLHRRREILGSVARETETPTASTDSLQEAGRPELR